MPSIIPGYEYDIFISYRQKDNKHDGWVTEFVDNLKGELESTFKEEISVYFDINPHDGLLETYDVDASLKEKLKCLIFIPIISRTYCDPKSFAWEHEFRAFVELASKDQFGLRVRLPNGNVANRVLPVRIYDLNEEDIRLCESVIGGSLRGIEFIYKSAGVNRPLRSMEEKPHDNLNKTIYRDQINKVSNTIDEIIQGLKTGHKAEIKEKVLVEPKQERLNHKDRIKSPKKKREIRRKKLVKYSTFAFWSIGLLIMTTLIYFGVRWYKSQQKITWAKQVQIPGIQKLISEDFFPSTKAFELAEEVEKIIPGDSSLISFWPIISGKFTLGSEPSGGNYFWKNYDEPNSDWNFIGTTPLLNVRLPAGPIRIKVERKGFQTILQEAFIFPSNSSSKYIIRLDSLGTLPDNMVRITSQTSSMLILGLEQYGGKTVGEFLADQFEVTNKEYKRFVDSGGYSNRNYWHYPISMNGRKLPWNEAIKLFIDKTGRLGPSTWEVGSYPDGADNFPVAGISWYEASAYAEFVQKKLPTVYQWSLMADTWIAKNILPLSNFNGISTVPVGKMEGISSAGLYDIAGNVREWCMNGGNTPDQHFILGGGYNDPTYAFTCASTQPSLDRSSSNGFRCIKELSGDSTINSMTGNLELAFRDYKKEKPVDDKTFRIYLNQFTYDKLPLNAKVVKIKDPGAFNIEKVTLDAAYNNEQFDIWLFLPKGTHPPYQAIILFPGSSVIQGGEFLTIYKTGIYDVNWMDFIVRSGRVLVCPVLKGTYERSDALTSDLENESVFYKDHVIMWRKDLGRTIDYLETREDILSDKIGYLGLSWGGFLGGIMPAVEIRIKAVALCICGMQMYRALPEVDQINFLPRVHQPILMMNGIHNMFFPVETSQKPMYSLLGSKIKEAKTYNEGHLVPRQDLIKETLKWYDQYLGEVKK